MPCPCRCCQTPSLTPALEARQATATATRAPGYRWWHLDNSGDPDAWDAVWYLAKTVTTTSNTSGSSDAGNSIGSYSVTSTFTLTLTYTADDPDNPGTTTYSKAWFGGGSSTDTSDYTYSVYEGGEGGIPLTLIYERKTRHNITATYTVHPDGSITTETRSIYFESTQNIGYDPEPVIITDTDETTTETGGPNDDDDIPASISTAGPTSGSDTSESHTTTVTLSSPNPRETREQLIARATADADTYGEWLAPAQAFLSCPVEPVPGAAASVAKAQWRIAHEPSPTCHLRVWPLLATATYPDGLPAETDPDPSDTPLETYEWNGTGKPCVTNAAKPPSDPANRVEGEAHDLPVPSTPGSTTVRIRKWSLLPTYTPPDDGTANNLPRPPSA